MTKIKLILIYLLITFILTIEMNANSSTSSVTTYTFKNMNQVSGNVEKIKVYGSPGYGETPQVDTIETAIILKLKEPINVICTDPKEEINFDTNASEIQLVAFDFEDQINTAIKNHRQIVVKGKFFSAHTAHHVRKLLMDVKYLQILK